MSGLVFTDPIVPQTTNLYGASFAELVNTNGASPLVPNLFNPNGFYGPFDVSNFDYVQFFFLPINGFMAAGSVPGAANRPASVLIDFYIPAALGTNTRTGQYIMIGPTVQFYASVPVQGPIMTIDLHAFGSAAANYNWQLVAIGRRGQICHHGDTQRVQATAAGTFGAGLGATAYMPAVFAGEATVLAENSFVGPSEAYVSMIGADGVYVGVGAAYAGYSVGAGIARTDLVTFPVVARHLQVTAINRAGGAQPIAATVTVVPSGS